MFPKADIPVVQLSVNADFSPAEAYETGKMLASLRNKGILIFGSGNIVHNLRLADWNNDIGTKEAIQFNEAIVNALLRREDQKIIEYYKIPNAAYAVPTKDHYYPLLYILGTAGTDAPEIFNNVCNLGPIAMTGALFRN